MTSSVRPTLRCGAPVIKHHKLPLIAPALKSLGWTVDSVVIDTDQLGTFAGDVPRPFSPLETARRKTVLYASNATSEWLLASEGTVTSKWGLIPLDLELVVAIHQPTNVMVVGRANSTDIHCVQDTFTADVTRDALTALAQRADLPRHHLVVSTPTNATKPYGAINDTEELWTRVRELLMASPSVTDQTDLRAHLCPLRQPVIAAAAQDLAATLQRRCPQCQRGGWHVSEAHPGAPCRGCGLHTEGTRALLWSCPWCQAHLLEETADANSDPAECGFCNP